MFIGAAIDRVDGRDKVTGRARYAAEFSPDGVVYAVMVQSTIPSGTITGFDLARANAMPGVLGIVTPDNAGRFSFPFMRDRTIRYNGQTVAIVIADTFERATAAAFAVGVQTRASRAAPVMDPAMRVGEGAAANLVGDADAGFALAAVKVDATYVTPVEHHNPMEPHATVARWDADDRLTVWTATQGISGAKRTFASFFGLRPENVVVICPYVGGGFGCKGNTWPPAIFAALAAWHVRRPVKLVVTRAQMFTSNGYRPLTVQRLRLGADANGRLQSIRHDAATQSSMPEVGQFVEAVTKPTRMLYASPAIAAAQHLVTVNQGQPTYMRAPGDSSGAFALECAMDELAVALRMDPLAVRLANYAERDPTENKPFASKALRACYEQAASRFGWEKRSHAPGSMRDGRVLVGWGMATSTYPTNRHSASARVRLLPDGSAVVQSGTQDIGTGTYTTMTQVAADVLGLPMARVRAQLGDSRLPPAPVSGGSSTSASVLPAVQAAATAARTTLLTLAADHWPGARPDALTLKEGVISCPQGRATVADVLARHNRKSVDAEAETDLSEDAAQYSRHAFGAQFAEVRIDPDLGTIRVARIVSAFDCGRPINRKTVESQLYGGIVFGIGMALFEETRIDARTGRVLNQNISDYLVPVNLDVPVIEAFTVETEDTVSTPLGLKGVGELPMVGIAPAIANAVYHATGKRVRRLPIRIEDVI